MPDSNPTTTREHNHFWAGAGITAAITAVIAGGFVVANNKEAVTREAALHEQIEALNRQITNYQSAGGKAFNGTLRLPSTELEKLRPDGTSPSPSTDTVRIDPDILDALAKPLQRVGIRKIEFIDFEKGQPVFTIDMETTKKSPSPTHAQRLNNTTNTPPRSR